MPNTDNSHGGGAVTLEETVWTGRGFSPKPGTLRLCNGRLQFTLNGALVFDAPLEELRISWPWLGFGCQFVAHAANGAHFISFLGTGNSLGSWARGVRNGQRWHRAIMAIPNRPADAGQKGL